MFTTVKYYGIRNIYMHISGVSALREREIVYLFMVHVAYKVFRHSKRKLVLCSKQAMRLAETGHVICFSQSHGLFTTKYKFWFIMLKTL